MATTSINLGTTDRLKALYSYPNDPTSGESLADTILHWFNMTLARDCFTIQGASASVRVSGGRYFLDIDGPPGVAEYAVRLPKFLDVGEAALKVVAKLKRSREPSPDAAARKKLERPTSDKLWDPQNTKQWRFFLPHGMAMVKQTTLNFFHYPPMRLLDAMRDYLDDPVPVRLIELMQANGVKSEQEAWLYSTVMDGAPIAAPDDQGTQYVKAPKSKSVKPVHLIPIGAFHEYQRAQTELLLTPVGDAYTIPVVAYGAPGLETFTSLYLQGEKPLGALDARTVEVIPGRKTAVIGCGHPYRFYAGAQISDTTEVGCGYILPAKCEKAVKCMVDDLIVVRWQVQMAKDPSQDPKQVLSDCSDYWQHRDYMRDHLLCQLVQHQGSLLYPDPNSLEFTFNLSMADAGKLCTWHANNPCAQG